MVERRIETALVQSVSASGSLRTTVPQPVAAMMGLEKGDHIVWVVDPQAGTIGVTAIHKKDLEPVTMGSIEARVLPESKRRSK
jgi:hypothetical protein